MKDILKILVGLAWILPASVFADSSKRVAVYNGVGVCEGCPQDIESELKRAGYSVDLLEAKDVTLERLQKYDLYIQPGGDNTIPVKRALGPSGMDAIRSFVRSGGHFIGICLGAFMADADRDTDGSRDLGLISASALPQLSRDQATPQKVIVQDPKDSTQVSPHIVSTAYYQAGPRFVPIEAKGDRGKPLTIACYQYTKNDQRISQNIQGACENPAAVMNTYGKGSALAIGFHPEANASWCEQDGCTLGSSDIKFQNKVFQSMIKKVLTFGSTGELP